jgi:hypothetical protein
LGLGRRVLPVTHSLRRDLSSPASAVSPGLDSTVSAVLRRLSGRDDAETFLWKLLEILPGEIQVLHEQLRRKVAEPLRKRDLFVSGRSEHATNCMTSLPVFST